MSSIYIIEPPTNGKVLLQTTFGEIEIELWPKETPKACRNFVQLCLEGYYNGTIFHRVEKGFIGQGGDPTGTGMGGESVYGVPFKDEIHSRLRFCRRGLVALANAGKNDNGSQFFFTFAATPELQGKHTIFGKVAGDTIYNLSNLESGFKQEKIIKAEVLFNPFDDIVPRRIETPEVVKVKEPVKKEVGIKNFSLLSFGDEAEEDEIEANVVNEKYTGKSKSTHDLLCDSSLSSEPAIIEPVANEELSAKDVKMKLAEEGKKRKKRLEHHVSEKKPIPVISQTDDEEKDDKKSIEKIRKEIKSIVKELKGNSNKKETVSEGKENIDEDDAGKSLIREYKREHDKYMKNKEQIPSISTSREEHTLYLLNKFKSKLEVLKEKMEEDSSGQQIEQPKSTTKDDEEEMPSDDWYAQKLICEDHGANAKDANLKTDDWYEIYDPRNPLTKRRRENNKESEKNRWKHYKPND